MRSQNVVDQLAGSLKTAVPYIHQSIARKRAALALAMRYLPPVSITQFRQHFLHYIQRVRDGETIVLTHRKYPHDRFVIHPHKSKTDPSVIAELVCV